MSSLTSAGLWYSSEETTKKRIWQCGDCSGCMAKDCGTCKYCLDKPKFGGLGIKKQKCIVRTCSVKVMKRTSSGVISGKIKEMEKIMKSKSVIDNKEEILNGMINLRNKMENNDENRLLNLTEDEKLINEREVAITAGEIVNKYLNIGNIYTHLMEPWDENISVSKEKLSDTRIGADNNDSDHSEHNLDSIISENTIEYIPIINKYKNMINNSNEDSDASNYVNMEDYVKDESNTNVNTESDQLNVMNEFLNYTGGDNQCYIDANMLPEMDDSWTHILRRYGM